MIHQVQTRKNDRNGVSSCTPQFRTPSRQEPRAPTCPRSQAQSRAATPVLTDGQPIASIPNCAPAPMRRPRSATGLRERAAALTHPWWRSTGRVEASSLGRGSDELRQGRRTLDRLVRLQDRGLWRRARQITGGRGVDQLLSTQSGPSVHDRSHVNQGFGSSSLNILARVHVERQH